MKTSRNHHTTAHCWRLIAHNTGSPDTAKATNSTSDIPKKNPIWSRE